VNKIDPKTVPEFRDLVHFTQWYLASNMPILLPDTPEVFLSDDATATCLFRHGRYQFEMYLIHPNPVIPAHEHPGVDNIEIPSGSWGDFTEAVLQSRMQTAGLVHGGNIRIRAQNAGFALFSAQRWDEDLEMSTIGARWKGHTAGPKHDALIKRFNPDCLQYPGYADVTAKRPAVSPIL
jgi:hypothetical protein